MVEMRREARRARGREGGARARPPRTAAAAKADGASPADGGAADGRRSATPPGAARKPSPGTARVRKAGSRSKSKSKSKCLAAVFITLEGIDRSGKTTQAALLAEALGPETLLLREPGGTDAGERIRELLKDPASSSTRAPSCSCSAPPGPSCAHGSIRPALDQGRDVVCDRFVDSTVAYQGAARGLGSDVVERLNEIAIAGCMPDVTVLLADRPRAGRGPRPAAARGGRRRRHRSLRGRGHRVPAPGRGGLRRARRPAPRADRRRRRRRRAPRRCTSEVMEDRWSEASR